MKKIGNIIVKVISGNIAEQLVDCIVVPQISRHAFYKMGIAKKMYEDGMKHGMLLYDFHAKHHVMSECEAFVSIAGKHNIKLVHIVTADCWRDEQYSTVFKAIFNALVVIANKKWKFIAIPEIGTGVIGNLTQRQAAHAVFAAIYQFTELFQDNGIEEIRFIIANDLTEPAEEILEQETYKTMQDEIGQKPFDAQSWLKEMEYAR